MGRVVEVYFKLMIEFSVFSADLIMTNERRMHILRSRKAIVSILVLTLGNK